MKTEDLRPLAMIANSAGTCHGICYWFDLILDSETTYRSESRSRTNHWKQGDPLLSGAGGGSGRRPAWTSPAGYDNTRIFFSICSATSRAEAAHAQGIPMKARIEWIEGRVFIGTSNSGHGIVIAAPTAPGAVTIAPSPMEYVLLGTGGCTATDVVMTWRKAVTTSRGDRSDARRGSSHGKTPRSSPRSTSISR